MLFPTCTVTSKKFFLPLYLVFNQATSFYGISNFLQKEIGKMWRGLGECFSELLYVVNSVFSWLGRTSLTWTESYTRDVRTCWRAAALDLRLQTLRKWLVGVPLCLGLYFPTKANRSNCAIGETWKKYFTSWSPVLPKVFSVQKKIVYNLLVIYYLLLYQQNL